MLRAICLKQTRKLFDLKKFDKFSKEKKLNHDDIASLKLAYGIKPQKKYIKK